MPNMVDCTVIEILSPPYYKEWIDEGNKVGIWCISVKEDCWGNISETIICKNTKEEIDEIKVGYEYEVMA